MKVYKFIILLVILALLSACSSVMEESGSNQAPIITINAHPESFVEDSEVLTFDTSAVDPDGDSVSYQWGSSYGTFSSPNCAVTQWTAPDLDGEYTPIPIFLSVTDSNNNQSGYSWGIYLNYSASAETTTNDSQENETTEDSQDQPVTVDPTVTPAIPQDCYANTQESQFIVTWNHVTEYMDGNAIGANLSGYKIYMATNETGPYSLFTTVSPNINSFTFNTVGSQLWFKISAFSGDGVESLLSGAFTSQDNSAPGIPSFSDVRGYSPDNNNISLWWGANSESDFAGYRIYRAKGEDNHDGVYTIVGQTGSNAFYDTTATEKDVYWYRVSAYDFSGNESAMSRIVCVDNISPGQVTGISADSGMDSGTVTITWTPVGVSDLAGYRIYISDNAGGPYIELADEEEVTEEFNTYTATGLTAGQTYHFYMYAYDVYQNRSTAVSDTVSAAAAN